MNKRARADNANVQFTAHYEFDGIPWALEIWAATQEEAEMKLKAVGRGTITGVHCGVVTVDGKCPTCKQPWEGDTP